ncbi:cupin domain-containing protein [Paenibacillus sp. TAB 01]|uniref:cupin domain-containing protein n=1 Tax=Paenibacillus sp. TAB 01 TaxID=3368988 RepID=UPI003752A27C
MKISKNNGEHYIWGEACDGWHLVKNRDLSVIHERMPPGTSEIRHYHVQARQFFFVLNGTAELELNGETFRLQSHEGIEVGPGLPHQMKNTSEADVEFLVISHPQTRGDRIAADE